LRHHFVCKKGAIPAYFYFLVFSKEVETGSDSAVAKNCKLISRYNDKNRQSLAFFVTSGYQKGG